MTPIILASSSPTRKTLLTRLGLPFHCVSPDIDETPLVNETAAALVLRLAQAKAQAVARHYPHHIIIAADVVGQCQDQLLNKPENHATAVNQLLLASNTVVTFYTGLCVFNATNKQEQLTVETYQVYFRALTLNMIESYLRQDQPYQCAGSIKAESLASVLFQRLVGDDYTTLLGLPLIKLISMLENTGVLLI